MATIEVGMATWAVFRKHKSIQNPHTQAKIEAMLKEKWCKNNVFANSNAIIQWHFIPHLVFFDPTITQFS
jgi:hypothetical protein